MARCVAGPLFQRSVLLIYQPKRQNYIAKWSWTETMLDMPTQLLHLIEIILYSIFRLSLTTHIHPTHMCVCVCTQTCFSSHFLCEWLYTVFFFHACTFLSLIPFFYHYSLLKFGTAFHNNLLENWKRYSDDCCILWNDSRGKLFDLKIIFNSFNSNTQFNLGIQL